MNNLTQALRKVANTTHHQFERIKAACVPDQGFLLKWMLDSRYFASAAVAGYVLSNPISPFGKYGLMVFEGFFTSHVVWKITVYGALIGFFVMPILPAIERIDGKVHAFISGASKCTLLFVGALVGLAASDVLSGKIDIGALTASWIFAGGVSVAFLFSGVFRYLAFLSDDSRDKNSGNKVAFMVAFREASLWLRLVFWLPAIFLITLIIYKDILLQISRM